jgi:type IV pilus assembly protein PilX
MNREQYTAGIQRIEGTMKQERESIMKNERGIALIVAMVMLLLLTMIGIFALNTSSTELRIVGNYKNTEVAFFAADGGVAFGQTATTIYNSLVLAPPLPVTSWNGSVPVSYNSADVGVVWVASSSIVPAKIAAVTDPDAVKVINHFVGTVTGHGPNNATVVIESEFVRLY